MVAAKRSGDVAVGSETKNRAACSSRPEAAKAVQVCAEQGEDQDMSMAQDQVSQPVYTGGGVTIVLCFLVAMFEGIDLQAAGVTAPQIAPIFKLIPSQLGLFFSASTFGLLIGAAVGGRAADLIGRKRSLITALIVFGLFSTATAFSWSFTGLVWTRALTGLGLGGALPIIVALVSENCNPARRNTAIGLVYGGLPIGGTLASATSLITVATPTWKIVFLVGGLAPLLLAPALMLWLPESAEFKAAKQVVAQTAERVSLAAALFGANTLKTVLLWISFFLTLLILYLLLNWLPSLLVGHGFSRHQASFIQIAFNLGGAVGSVVIGLLMDSRHRRITTIVGYAGTILALIWLANIPSALALAIAAGGAVGVTLLGAQTILYGLAPRCYATAVRGSGVGAAVVAGRVGSLLGPLLAAVLIGGGQGGVGIVWRLLPIVVLAAIAAVLLVSRTERQA
jgi:AAHS family 3-hydroxyphenylpropionic acid transporter